MKFKKSIFRKIIAFMIITLLPLPLASCSGASSKQIQGIYLVIGLGVDLEPINNKVEVIMEVLNPAASSSQTNENPGNTGSKNESLIFKGVGETLFDAVYDASKSMSKIQHFGHVKYIVVGDAVARRGIKPLIDSLCRIEEVRLNTPFFITKGKAFDVIKAETPENPISGLAIESLFYRQGLIGYRPLSYLLDFVRALSSPNTNPVAAELELTKSKYNGTSQVFNMSGAAVFKKDKLIGYLNDRETRGFMWVMGSVEVGSVSFTSPDTGKGTVEILSSKSKITPAIKGNCVAIDVNIFNTSDLRRIGNNVDPVKHPEIMDKIGSLESESIKREVELALKAAKDDMGADIFGFGDKIHAKNPKLWKSIGKDWDNAFQDIDVDVTVNSKVRATGLITKSLK